MDKKDDSIYIMHILDATNRIEEYTATVDYEEFMNNKLVQAAVIREIEVIGEAAKKLSEKFRKKHLEIPWKRIAGMRDKLIHNYFGVDMDAVWETVKKDIPELKEKVLKIKKLME